MKFDNLRAFEKHLEAAAGLQFSSVFTLISKDSFDCKRGFEALLRIMKWPVKSYEASKLEEALGDLDSFSLFSEKKMVHLKGVEQLKKAELTLLHKTLGSLPQETCLVLSGSALHRGSSLYKGLEEQGVILDIPELKAWEKEKVLEGWIVEYIGAAGKKISLQTAKQLVKQSGTDQSLLLQEMEKLICFAWEKKTIEMADVATITSSINQETIWQLGEALFARNASTAFRITKALIEDGLPILILLRQIRSQFQTDYQVCCLLDKGQKQEVSKQFPYMKGFILERHLQQASQYGMARFKRGLLKIDETEIALKSSGVAPELLTDLLIAELCQ